MTGQRGSRAADSRADDAAAWACVVRELRHALSSVHRALESAPDRWSAREQISAAVGAMHEAVEASVEAEDRARDMARLSERIRAARAELPDEWWKHAP